MNTRVNYYSDLPPISLQKTTWLEWPQVQVTAVLGFINPRHACAARVTVLGLCVCVCLSVCLFVCVSVTQHLTLHVIIRTTNDSNLPSGE